MESIAELVAELGRPGVDLFESHRRRELITVRGREAVRELVSMIQSDPALVSGLLRDTLRRLSDPEERDQARNDLEHHLAADRHVATRKVCIEMLVEVYPDALYVGRRLLDFAVDRAREPKDLRLSALEAVAKLQPTSTLAAPLVSLLQDEDQDIVHKVLGILHRYPGFAQGEEVTTHLERLASPTSSPDLDVSVRSKAIELLGQFGEVDILERVLLLPLTGERETEAVGKLVQHLLRRPRSVLHLSPASFERVTARLLEKMGYEEVKDTRKGSWDDGVDVVAYYLDAQRMGGTKRLKVVVQCKRYHVKNLVGPDVVTTMVASLQEQQAARGVIITTSRFMRAATDLGRKHQNIELIDGPQLQGLFDKYFGKGLYRVAF